MKFLSPLFFLLLACSSAEDVPEASHIEARDTINYRKEISDHSSDLRKCFIKHAPDSEIVNLSTILIIDPNGRVTKKSFRANKTLNEAVVACLSEVVDDMDFVKPSRGGTIEVTHITKFKVSD